MDFNIIEEKYGTCFLSDYVLCYIDYLNYFKSIGVKGIILNEELIDKNKFLNIIKMYKENIIKNKYTFNDVKKLVPNVDLGFLNTKTIYKDDFASNGTNLSLIGTYNKSIVKCDLYPLSSDFPNYSDPKNSTKSLSYFINSKEMADSYPGVYDEGRGKYTNCLMRYLKHFFIIQFV